MKINKGPWPKITRLPFNNTAEITIVEEADGVICIMVAGSFNMYSMRHAPKRIEIDLEPRK